MKHPTVKRPPRSVWRRAWRALVALVDELGGDEAWLDPQMPRTLEDFNQTRAR